MKIKLVEVYEKNIRGKKRKLGLVHAGHGNPCVDKKDALENLNEYKKKQALEDGWVPKKVLVLR